MLQCGETADGQAELDPLPLGPLSRGRMTLLPPIVLSPVVRRSLRDPSLCPEEFPPPVA